MKTSFREPKYEKVCHFCENLVREEFGSRVAGTLIVHDGLQNSEGGRRNESNISYRKRQKVTIKGVISMSPFCTHRATPAPPKAVPRISGAPTCSRMFDNNARNQRNG